MKISFFALPFISLALLLILISVFCLSTCDRNRTSDHSDTCPSLTDIPESSWEKLSKKKFFFGHQSVGFNIIEGIRSLIKKNPQINLNIIETKSPAHFNNSIFAHFRIGENMNPVSKINAFTDFLEKGIGDKADYAFFKFCYVDFSANTNVNEIFNIYQRNLANLKKKFKKTNFIHVTVPLVSQQTGPKVWIKKIIKKPIRGYEGNKKRNEYNELLREKYGEKEPLFDLAKIESTYPDRKRSFFEREGKTFYTLVPAYTNDGGHLNEIGSERVASQLLIYLEQLIEQ